MHPISSLEYDGLLIKKSQTLREKVIKTANNENGRRKKGQVIN